MAVLTACTVFCGLRLRSAASGLQPRITGSLDRLAGTTILGCHPPSLLNVYAATAAQLLSDKFWAYKMARKLRGLAGTYSLSLISGLVKCRTTNKN
jgi:hypothetical protein